jgi:hypothetical protein
MPDIDKLKGKIIFNIGVLFPMFDYYYGCTPLENPIWFKYKNFLIINFCKSLHNDLERNNYHTRYIQYFPKPRSLFPLGQKHSAFLWQRLSNINGYLVLKLLKKIGCHSLHQHFAVDPGETEVDVPDLFPEAKGINLTRSSWFENKESIYKEIEKSAFYIAPRDFEGIGMSFLEAMAMGRCVIAPDNPTMNEYIIHGVTGLLYKREEIIILSEDAWVLVPSSVILL